MSSLAAVQADGYYYPPNWSPSKGNKDKFHHVCFSSVFLVLVASSWEQSTKAAFGNCDCPF